MLSHWHSLFASDYPGELIGIHDHWLVALSVAITAFGAYTALDLAARIRASEGFARHVWLLLSAVAMGGSIWSMHFVAMLAFQLEIPVTYDIPLTLASFGAAVILSAAGIAVAYRPSKHRAGHLLAAGGCVGLGIAIMHYVGMAAMQLDATLVYNHLLLIASVVAAATAGGLALWAAAKLDHAWRRIAAAFVMTAAIGVTHFTGMAATHFMPPSNGLVREIENSADPLALLVAAATLGVLGLGLVSAAVDRRFAARTTREAETLRVSERYLHDVLNTTLDAYIAMDAAGRVTDWNAEAARLFDRTRYEALGESFSSIVLAEEDRDVFHRRLRSYIDQGDSSALGVRVEMTALHRNGASFPVEVTLAPVHRLDAVTFHAFLHDISARKEVEHELIAAKEVADASNRAKSEFLAQMSHELRTPLNAIIAFSEIIRDRMLGNIGDDAYRGYAGDIHSSGQHLLEVINDILDLSKAEAGYLDVKARAFKVPEMLTRCVDTVREIARKADIELSMTVPSGLPLVVGEERRIRQVVLNLLANALKFTPAGGWVSVRADRSADGDLEIVVEDTGIGMSPDQIQVAVTPFGQIENQFSRRYEGAGLGLPLAKRFIELHDGRLTIDSVPGKGTRVTSMLPKARLRDIRLLSMEAA